ncbi:alpha/beta hydrolase [Pseudomonas moorei]|nr:alpha/beta hydrolase [Pseudomonas moorei]
MKLYRDFVQQEEIDLQYDCESSLNMPPIIDWVVGSSKKTRDDLVCHLDQRFGPTLDETVDIFPAEEPNAPVLIIIHGGWWRVTSSKEWSFLARGPVGLGFTVVVTNYSLCPKVSIDEITRQTRAAVAWVHGNASRFNGDPDRIFVAGHSAGGHLVGMLAITDWSGEYGLPNDVVKGGIPISGLFDLRPFRHSWLQPKLQLNYDTIERQSPLFHVPADTSKFPMLITLGGDEPEEFHRQSKTFADAWAASGGFVRLLDQPGKNHFTALEGFESAESELCRAILELVANREGASLRTE